MASRRSGEMSLHSGWLPSTISSQAHLGVILLGMQVRVLAEEIAHLPFLFDCCVVHVVAAWQSMGEQRLYPLFVASFGDESNEATPNISWKSATETCRIRQCQL